MSPETDLLAFKQEVYARLPRPKREGTRVINTDAAFTLTPRVDAPVVVHTGTLTANRAVTLATANAVDGDRFRLARNGPGAFTLDVGALKSLATNTWGDFTFVSTAWVLTGYGAL